VHLTHCNTPLRSRRKHSAASEILRQRRKTLTYFMKSVLLGNAFCDASVTGRYNAQRRPACLTYIPFRYDCALGVLGDNINWRDVQRKNVVNNADRSSLRAPWQNGSVTKVDVYKTMTFSPGLVEHIPMKRCHNAIRVDTLRRQITEDGIFGP